jgi:hypothetical protein
MRKSDGWLDAMETLIDRSHVPQPMTGITSEVDEDLRLKLYEPLWAEVVHAVNLQVWNEFCHR